MTHGQNASTPPSRGAMFRRLALTLTWREFAFHAVQFAIAIAALCWLALASVIGALFAVTGIGLPGAARLFRSVRWVAAPAAAASSHLLGQHVMLAPHTPGHTVRDQLRDAATWRAYAYSLCAFVLTAVAFFLSVFLLGVAAAAVTLPLWPLMGVTLDGEALRSPYSIGVIFLAGVALLIMVWPNVNHGLAGIQVLTQRALLGPTATETRLAELTASRNTTLQDSHAVLRRVERDLHDGTQARLVSVAMMLGDALDRLRHGADPTTIEHQLASALNVTTQTLGELRALVRGIHPPILDSGLDAALRSIIGQAKMRTHLLVELPQRPSPVIESIVYFAVLELVTNVHKHANANSAAVEIRDEHDGIVVRICDDGCGGAMMPIRETDDHGSGLAGIRERLRAVDGTFVIDSPAGGPTIALLTIPKARLT